MKKLYIISGPNGAGKTTASYTVLPEILNCTEFVNADEIAKGLSPFNPEKVAFTAGRIMLERIHSLIESEKTFAFETTLSTKSYKSFIKLAKKKNYQIILLYLYLTSDNLAVSRVNQRVIEGGHNIPEPVIRRRYIRGLLNFFSIYCDLADKWLLIDNSGIRFELIAESIEKTRKINNLPLWKSIQKKLHGN